MPLSLRQALADALVLDHPDAPWQPPEALPHPADLRRGVALLEEQLRRADKKHAAYCLAKLYAGFNERLTAGEIDAKVDIWIEVCAAIPNDLWADGVMELLRSWRRDAHFGRIPEPADLLDIVKVRLDKRLLDLKRTKAMLARANEPAADQAPVKWLSPNAQAKRLREVLEEQRNRDGLTDAERLHVMAHTERSLAMYEKRLMSPWAEEFFQARIKPSDSIGQLVKAAVERAA